MPMMNRPTVTTLSDGAKYWEHEYDSFYLKTYVPINGVDGQVHNYTFRAPLLLVFEENRQSMKDAIAFASVSGQGHECRYHTNENAWKFISQFTR